VAPVALVHPAQVHHAVNGLVRDLRGELVVGQVERLERQRPEVDVRGAAAQVSR
jgi:hypothetical protein